MKTARLFEPALAGLVLPDSGLTLRLSSYFKGKGRDSGTIATTCREMEASPRSWRWRLRALLGERVRWYQTIEEQG